MYHTSDRTIVYITGVYDTLDLFTDKLREAFEKMGYGSFVYDARFGDTGKELLVDMLKPRQGDTDDGELTDDNTQHCQWRDALDIPLDHDVPHDAPPAPVIVACVTFNNLGYNLTLPDGRNIWEACEIPYINILMDHPFHYEKPLSEAPSTSIVLCTDNNHVRYVRRYFPDIRNVDFLPHAGVELGSKHKTLSERGIDVLYAGALPIYTVGRMIPDLGAIPDVDGEKLAADVLSALVSDPNQTTECVIEDCLRERKRDISDKRIHELIVELRFLDSYATAFFREQAVRLLVESGIRVTVFGEGWDKCDWSDNPYLDYRGKVLAPEILPLMNDSKIVLNTMTWFKSGAHDRIFNGMLSRAAVVTDDSDYLHREFTDGRELAIFELNDIGLLPEKVFDLFGHMNRTQEMADRGYEAAKAHHTWAARAEAIEATFLHAAC